MTLLITAAAAVSATLVWYSSPRARAMKVSTLMYMYWGASLMWLVDAAAEYLSDGADYFVPSGADMVNDAFLGASAVVLGLIVWSVYLLIKDPSGIVKSIIAEKNSK